jgi:hypothetical protein
MSVAALIGVVSVDAADIVALARDPRRHAFLLRTTGSDHAAQAEIAAAQRLLAAQHEPDLRALLELAVYRNAMSLRNQCLPFALPGVWARLGRLDHAEALARTITDPAARGAALEDVATAAAEAGDLDRAARLAADAEALAQRITDPEDLSSVLIGLARAAAEAGDPGRAEALARTVPDPCFQVETLGQLASIAAEEGDRDRAVRLATEAEATARTITLPYYQARALDELAMAAARTGDLDRARDLLALALSTDSPEIVWWMEALTECFPDVIRDAGHMFLTALVPDGSAEQLAGDD